MRTGSGVRSSSVNASRWADAPVEVARPLSAPGWPAYAALALVGALGVAATLRGKLITLLAWACLFLFLGLLSLWLRSYRHADLLTRSSLLPTPGVNRHRVVSFQSSGGGLRIHVRSYPAANGIPPNHSADLSTRIGWEYRSVAPWEWPRYAFTDEDVAAAGPFARRWGILLLNGAKSTPFAPHVDRQTTVTVPYWLITMPLALPPLLYLRAKARRSRRIATNCCPSCGYDLRASAGRCPECGTNTVTREPGSSPSAPIPA